MSNKRMVITMVIALAYLFCWMLYHTNLLCAILAITMTAIVGIFIYYMQHWKRNDSMKVKFILLFTYIIGGMAFIFFPSIKMMLAELALFIIVILLTNRRKKGRIT